MPNLLYVQSLSVESVLVLAAGQVVWKFRGSVYSRSWLYITVSAQLQMRKPSAAKFKSEFVLPDGMLRQLTRVTRLILKMITSGMAVTQYPEAD